MDLALDVALLAILNVFKYLISRDPWVAEIRLGTAH
jgi:hypothetical protein